MISRSLLGGAAIATVLALSLAQTVPAGAHETQRTGRSDGEAAAEARAEAAGERLGSRIRAALREGEPFFTAEERAVIERACGMPAGSWDGFEANMSDGGLTCSNGRRVDSAEVRAVMEAAGPRIGRRVSQVMARADIEGEVERITREATAIAMASIDQAEIAREAAAAAGAALEGAREEIEVARREAEAARRRRQ